MLRFNFFLNVVVLLKQQKRPMTKTAITQHWKEPSIHKSLLFPGLLLSETWNLINFLSIHISHNTVGSRDCHQPWRMVLIPTQLRKYHLSSCLSRPVCPLSYPLPSSSPCDNLMLPNICYFWDVRGKGTLNWRKIFSVQGIFFQQFSEVPAYSTCKCTKVMIRVQKQNRKDLGGKIQPSLKWAKCLSIRFPKTRGGIVQVKTHNKYMTPGDTRCFAKLFYLVWTLFAPISIRHSSCIIPFHLPSSFFFFDINSLFTSFQDNMHVLLFNFGLLIIQDGEPGRNYLLCLKHWVSISLTWALQLWPLIRCMNLICA